MIIDSNTVLIDQLITATVTGAAVGLTSLEIPGRAAEEIYLTIKAKDFAGLTSATITLTQADTATGSYTAVPNFSQAYTLAQLKLPIPTGTLPVQTLKPWIKCVVTVAGSATAGYLFVALTREQEQPYNDTLTVQGNTNLN